MENTYTAGELEKLAGKVAKRLNPNDVLALYGDLGSGKTTFTRYIVKALGFNARVQSPTFILVRNYTKDRSESVSPETADNNIEKIFHIDLYRLKNINEVLDIGIAEMITEDNSLTVIEWPEIYEHMLPDRTIKMFFEYVDEDTRKVKIENYV